MIAAIIGILAGGLSLTALVDNLAGTALTSSILNGLWSVLQFVITPISQLFTYIFDAVCSIIRQFFFS